MPAGTQNDFDDDDFDSDDPSSLVKQLRKQLKEIRKENDQLKAEVTTTRAESRDRTLNEALTAKGLNPKAAKFFPADAAVTQEAIDAWISDNADIFGAPSATAVDAAGQAPGDPGEGQAPVEQPAETFTPENEAAYRRLAAAQLVGSQATTREQDMLRQIAEAKSAEDLTAYLRSARA